MRARQHELARLPVHGGPQDIVLDPPGLAGQGNVRGVGTGFGLEPEGRGIADVVPEQGRSD